MTTPHDRRNVPAGVRRLLRLPFRGPARARADADAELTSYIALRVESLVARGMTPDDARAEAIRRLGGSLDEARAVLQQSAQLREASMRRRDLMEDAMQDIRYVIRGLRRRPGFTVTAVLCLAIAIGANATMFSVVDSLLLRPPAGVRDPARLLWINAQRTNPLGFADMSGLAYPDYVEFSHSPAIAASAAYATKDEVLGSGNDVRKIKALAITPSFMPLLGVQPVIGRFFTPADDVPGAAPSVVLGYDLWQSEFGSAPGVVGQTIHVGAATYAIIGVAPRGFNGVERAEVDVFLPALASASNPSIATTRSTNWLTMLARATPGVTRERIAQELDVRYHQAPNVGRSRLASKVLVAKPMSMVAMRSAVAVQNTTVALWLAAVAGVILIVACANVASLLVTRAARRRREIAIRLALGIDRGRLVRLLMTESTVIAGLGGIVGLLLAHWGGGLFRASLLTDGAMATSVFDGRVLVVTLIVTVLTSIACGLAPAIEATRPDLTEAMKTGDQAGDTRVERLLGGLLVGQVALTLVLLVGAGLFVRSLHNLDILDLGFDIQQPVRARVRAPAGSTPIEADQLAHRLLASAAQLPGAERATLATAGPFGNIIWHPVFVPERGPEENSFSPGMGAVTPGYFRTLGIPLARGRDFTNTDRLGTEPVAIVNEAMAQHLWPGAAALGKCIKIGSANAPCAKIVGVAGNARQGNIVRQSIQYERVRASFYVPFEQLPPEKRVGFFGIMLYVRGASDGPALVPAVTRLIAEQAAGGKLPDVAAFATLVEPQVRPWRIGVLMFGVFGLMALLLAVVGLHGVLAFRVAQRTREIGVRVALGATARDIHRVIVGKGLRLGALGVAIGCLGALTVGHAIGAVLFGVSPRDPVVLFAIGAVLLIAVLVASLIPARRATRVDPIAALRDL